MDAMELARSKVLLEGGGICGIVLVFLSFYLLNGRAHPESYRGLKLTSRGYWIYLAFLTFCSLPWLLALLCLEYFHPTTFPFSSAGRTSKGSQRFTWAFTTVFTVTWHVRRSPWDSKSSADFASSR